MKERDARVVIEIPAAIKSRLKRSARERGMSVTFIIKGLVENWLAQNPAAKGRPREVS